MKLLDYYLKHGLSQEELDDLAELMNQEIREQVHNEVAPCSPIEFLIAYCKIDTDFANLTSW